MTLASNVHDKYEAILSVELNPMFSCWLDLVVGDINDFVALVSVFMSGVLLGIELGDQNRIAIVGI